MNLKKILPDERIAIKKCQHFYNYGKSIEITRKNYRQIYQLYKMTGAILSLGMVYTLYECIRANKTGLDLLLFILIGLVIFITIYRMRYSSIDRLIKNNRREMIHALPNLIDRVILLLNAGMFIEGVIVKISEDYGKNIGEDGGNILFQGLGELIVKSGESNSSIIGELSMYAIRSGVREFIRFASIVENNFDKGDDLVEKLEGEGMLLWMVRKKQVEEKAKLVGTKLSLPLMLLLISLIMITSAPMFLNI